MLELKNIYKNYIQGNMDVPVLKNINLSVDEGEYVAIMGPSGSGKSTLMNIIGCIDKPTAGTYLLDGQEINNLNDKELSFVRNKQIGFVFQTFNLMPRQSALDNVGLPLQYAKVPKKERKMMCLEALDMVGLSDRVNFKPTQLSGGQKQRVAIARAMVNHPKILLADEPTGALDSKSGIQVMGLFRELHNQGVTIIMITHSDEIASYADKTVRIIDGELTDGAGNTGEVAE
ncbi:MAG: ABC transporter ATP-binding protein [Lachnospiraceae bacterium]|nr:ABC transporter ATP-binding protein [Lachnospiraceae bacterium]